MPPHNAGPQQPKPTMRSLSVGQLLCQFGDPPGPLYVILTGTLVVYRPNPNRPNENIELAQLGPGAVVGEVAPILGQLRSASVRAVVASTLLEIPVTMLGVLGNKQAPFIRVVAHALHERAGLSPADIATLVGGLGVDVPDLVELLASEGATEVAETAEPAERPGAAALYSKNVTCPYCDTVFSTQIVRLNKDQPVHQESDFHQIYDVGFNPYDYEPWVCPMDLYAALPADFAGLTADQRDRVHSGIEELVEREWGGERPHFSGNRTLDLRERALQIALVVSKVRAAPPPRIAALQHRLAWCARERGDSPAELIWLSAALGSYSAAHEQGVDGSTKAELRIEYLCGELTLRLGDRTGAQTWFRHALLHPLVKAHPMWQRMLSGQLEASRPQANNSG